MRRWKTSGLTRSGFWGLTFGWRERYIRYNGILKKAQAALNQRSQADNKKNRRSTKMFGGWTRFGGRGGSTRSEGKVNQKLIREGYSAVILIILFGLWIVPGCHKQPGAGWELYLTRDDIPPAQMTEANQIALTKQPLLAMADITSYNAMAHTMRITPEAFRRLQQLKVPVRGLTFVVCVDRQSQYWGAIWTSISSISFNGITIQQPLSPQNQPMIAFSRGYPDIRFYRGQDPVNSPFILQVLQKAGKLDQTLEVEDIEVLPASMKGYELYSWQQNSLWQFTLITGTNRNKKLEEIITGPSTISEDGWVKIQVSGTDALKDLLSKIPLSEWVTWIGNQWPEGQSPVQIPPADMVDSIQQYAKQIGLNFSAVQR
jgi:hypothetical protein